jgi:hypothetical protein
MDIELTNMNLKNNNNKIGTFIFVIGGTTKSRDFSDNYVLYPYWDENADE